MVKVKQRIRQNASKSRIGGNGESDVPERREKERQFLEGRGRRGDAGVGNITMTTEEDKGSTGCLHGGRDQSEIGNVKRRAIQLEQPKARVRSRNSRSETGGRKLRALKDIPLRANGIPRKSHS